MTKKGQATVYDIRLVYYGIPPIPIDQTYVADECPFCGNSERQNYVGRPINTYSGNYSYQMTDLSIPTLWQPLRFERTCNSLTVSETVVYSRPLGYAWTYVYSGTTHLLHEVVEPDLSERVIERTFFDDQGRATRQENGLAQAVVEINYGAASTRVVTETGKTITDSYSAQNMLVGQTDSLGNSSDYESDSHFNRSGTTDANGNETSFGRTQFGLVTSVTDAHGNVTGITYDSYNSPTRTVQAAGTSLAVTTTFAYTDTRFLTFMTAMTDGLGNLWEYRANAQGLLAVETDPLGNATRSGYDAYGQVTTMTVEGPDSSVVMTTTFGYDDLGQQVTVTRWLDGEPVVDVTRYDAAGR